jgi:hypothetical protein
VDITIKIAIVIIIEEIMLIPGHFSRGRLILERLIIDWNNICSSDWSRICYRMATNVVAVRTAKRAMDDR